MAETGFPTEEVKIPSKGLVYPESHPFSSGVVEMKYMSTREEDILTNQSFIEDGSVLDKVLKSMVIVDIDPKDIHPGDKNALLVSSRILGYGKDYEYTYNSKTQKVDLTTLENKPFDIDFIERGVSSFELPSNGDIIGFKFLTEKEEDDADKEIEQMAKITQGHSATISTRLKYHIVSINGDKDRNKIKNYIDNGLLASDSRALRNHIKKVSPDINLEVTIPGEGEVAIPITLSFFWPDF